MILEEVKAPQHCLQRTFCGIMQALCPYVNSRAAMPLRHSLRDIAFVRRIPILGSQKTG